MISEFEASLVYRGSSRTARATQRNSVSENEAKPNQTTIKTNKQAERRYLQNNECENAKQCRERCKHWAPTVHLITVIFFVFM